MRILVIPVIAVVLAWSFSACQSSSKPPVFCDTTCKNDTIRFTASHPDHPSIYISFVNNCNPDSIAWGHDRLATNRKMKLSGLTEEEVKINKSHIRTYFKDTSYVWVLFNDCTNGQGYIFKLPYDKETPIFRRNSAFNSLDPKFAVAENIAAWTDRGNVLVEDMTTGKQVSMTFGQYIDALDYNAIHETVDSVNITPTRIWVKVKIDGKWEEKEKKITLE